MIGNRIDVPELGAARSIQCVQPTIHRGDIDAALPHCHTAIDQIATRIARCGVVRLGIKAPEFPAARSIHGVNVTPGSRGNHDAVDHDRCGLLAAVCTQIVLPREAELLDIGRANTGQRTVVGSVAIAPARKPVLGGICGLRRTGQRGNRGNRGYAEAANCRHVDRFDPSTMHG